MLKRLRTNSKELVIRRRSSTQQTLLSSEDTPILTAINTTESDASTTKENVVPLLTITEGDTAASIPAAPTKPPLSFLELPAEIRNTIYTLCASTTSLSVGPTKRTKTPPAPIGLLLASQQIRREYRPILLSTAPVTVRVETFDFRNLNRVIASLYPTELKALRRNSRLRITFMLESDGSRLVKPLWRDNLRRWLNERGRNLDMLPFTYQVGWQVGGDELAAMSARKAAKARAARVVIVEAYLEALSRLHYNLVDTMRFEMHGVMAAFETELAVVERQLAQERDLSERAGSVGTNK